MRALSLLPVVLLSACVTNTTRVDPPVEEPASVEDGGAASAAPDAGPDVAPRAVSVEPSPPETVPMADAAPAGSPVALHGALSVDGTRLVDRGGRPFRLRGVSTARLDAPGALYAYSSSGLRWLRDSWGVNLLRVAAPIDTPDGGLLPAEDQERVVRGIESTIRRATQLGLYVLVDLESHHAHEHPDEARALFDRVSKGYGHLPNVLYEPFSEPLKVRWSAVLKPYHERIVRTIRDNGAAGVVVLGTPDRSLAVDEAALDQLAEPSVMYALHFSTCEHDSWLRDKADAAWARKLPMFVTAWSATYADDGHADHAVCSDTAGVVGGVTRSMTGDDWHAWMDTAGLSWAAWRYDACDDAACFMRPGAPETGTLGDEWLQGQGPYVRSKLAQK